VVECLLSVGEVLSSTPATPKKEKKRKKEGKENLKKLPKTPVRHSGKFWDTKLI
jgi:hypothetical protein